MTGHGDTVSGSLDELLPVLLGADHDLAMVNADPHAWMLAHPCECEALCVCDEDG